MGRVVVRPFVETGISGRQSEILARARAEGRVQVEALASAFGVTTQTIRRDLNELSRSGLLARIHGGATIANSVSNVGYAERRALAHEAKRAIGECAAALIPDGCSLIVNVGTTTEQVAHALRSRSDLVVITNNINVVNILSGSLSKQIILAGGMVRQADGAVVGEEAVQFMSRFKADYAVIGASALDEDGSILDFDLREIAVARAIVANVRKKILVSDHMKFDRSAPARICDITDIDVFVTDRSPPPRFVEACAGAGVTIEIADAAPTDDDDDL